MKNKEEKSVDELKKEIVRLKKELKSKKKYGLVWEEKTEDVVEMCKEKLPILKEDKDKEILTDENLPMNILIEGDNYHALSALNYTHAGKVDVIYIDPPYNTGAKDWKYNNDFVDKNDAYRHSKWLCMIEKRLRLAKKLLKQNGIICVTIDDNEFSKISLILDELFGEKNHLGTIAIRNNPAGRSTVNGISITHEYATFYGKSNKSKVGRLERNEIQKNRYNEEDELGVFEWVNFRKPGSMKIESPKMFYPIFATNEYLRLPDLTWNEFEEEWVMNEKPINDEIVIYPLDDNGSERRWRWGVDRFKNNLDQFKTKRQKGKLHIYLKGRTASEGVLPMTWWDKKEYSSTAYGTNLLKNIFSKLQVFSYPKSIYAVKDCINVLTENKSATILDFFAGSGTTGHAILELNQEDGGERKFILVTNNENSICTEVCYPRLEKVIFGYKNLKKVSVKGLNGNLKYFKTDFVEAKPTDKNKKKLTEESTEMLCIKEDTYEEVKTKNRSFRVFKNDKKYTGIIYDVTAIEDFKEFTEKIEGKFSVYVFSLSDDTYDEEFEDMKNKVKLSPIPEAILRVYRRIFK